MNRPASRLLVTSIVLAFVLVSCTRQPPPPGQEPVWPAYVPAASYLPLVEAALAEYEETGYDHTRRLTDHTATGDYLNYSTTNMFRNIEGRIRLDEEGVPTRNYGGEYYYNPVLIAQHAMNLYGRHLSGEDTLSAFHAAIDRLLSLQDERGAFLYDFEWQYYLLDEPYEPGWVSGMAQGMALSALARAYHLTGDEAFLAAGERALDFLLTPVADGGVMDTMADLHPSLERYVIFEEYLAEPASYTLNGFMYTLLGVYDWSVVASSARAGTYFAAGVETLRNVLPYYDLGGFSAYDLGHITWGREPHIGVSYHSVHIYLLHALHHVTGDEVLAAYSETWASYVR